MVEITLPIVLQIIQTVSLVVGILYYLIIMRNSQRTRELTLQSQELTRKAQEQALETRQAQLFMQLYNRLNEGEFCESYGKVVYGYEWEDFDDWKKKYHPKVDLDAWIPWVSVARFFLGIGTLVKRKLIDVDLVADIMGGPVIWTWDKMSPIVKELKVDLKRPQLWDDFEYLYNEIKNIEQHPELKI
jgi:hypothetical protein